MSQNDENLKNAFEHILTAIAELKTSNKEDIEGLKEVVREVHSIIDRQDLGKFPAGSLVNKKHCEKVADGIEKAIKQFVKEANEDQEKFNTSINTKLNWAYTIAVLAFGGTWVVLGFIARQVF